MADARGLPWSLKGTGAPETALVRPLEEGARNAGRRARDSKSGYRFCVRSRQFSKWRWPGRRTLTLRRAMRPRPQPHENKRTSYIRAFPLSDGIRTEAPRCRPWSDPSASRVQAIHPRIKLKNMLRSKHCERGDLRCAPSLVVPTDHSDPAAFDPPREREKAGGAPHFGCLCAAVWNESLQSPFEAPHIPRRPSG